MDRQLIDENGVGHSDQIEGEFDTKSRVVRNKNGNLKTAFEGDAAGKFSQGRTQQTDAGLEQTVFSGSGSALQDFAMSKTKTNGVQWANKTDLQGELGLSKG